MLLARGEEPTADMVRIVVPMSMRPDTAKNELDNRVSVMLPLLPVHIAETVRQLELVRDRMTKHKSRNETDAEASLLALGDRLPFLSVSWLVRLAARIPQRSITAVATNVPGPRHPLTLQGRKVLELWPVLPLAVRLRTGIAILSYGDRLMFGITGDFDSTPDIDRLGAGIHCGVMELLDETRRRKAAREAESGA